MCGIAGRALMARDQAPDRAVLERMISTLHHRGPDGYGYHFEPGVGLAHARLSIIDLATGDQPITNEDRTIWVVFNGEIFNYIELRKRLLAVGHRFTTQSDTEVLVHSYEEYGLDFVEHLNGQFAIALWDGRQRRLILARDRVGIRPLLYCRTTSGLTFASEAKALFASGDAEPALDPLGIAEVATFWSCIAPRTAFRDIQAIPPGHLAIWQAGHFQLRRYWDWRFPASPILPSGSLDDATEELRALFIDSVRLQLRADVPVGAYLSGGLDSSAVTAAVRRHGDSPLETFSLAFSDAEFDESSYQEQVASHVGTTHHRRTIRSGEIAAAFPRAMEHIESPVVRTAGIPLMLLADNVRGNGFKVVLTGEGADEVFGGYDLFKEAKIRRFWARQPGSRWRPWLLGRLYGYLTNSPTARRSLAASFFGQGLERPDDPFFAHRPRWATTSRILRLLDPAFREQIDRAHPLSRLIELAPRPDSAWEPLCRDQYVEAHTMLTGYLLAAQGDRVAMAASIEGRYPFLDHRLIEFANTLPARWKIRGLEEKYILRRAVKDWLPADVARRTKQPYRSPDSQSFFKNGKPLDYVNDLLSPSAVRHAGYFEPNLVTRLTEKCQRGGAIGFADNMAFVTVLSTQFLHHGCLAAWRLVRPTFS